MLSERNSRNVRITLHYPKLSPNEKRRPLFYYPPKNNKAPRGPNEGNELTFTEKSRNLQLLETVLHYRGKGARKK